MENTMNQAFTEVYDIILHFEKGMYQKLPKNFIETIKENRDLNYKLSIDYSKNINAQKLLQETRIILSLIYRDYICDEETRKRLIEEDRRQLEEEEKEKYEKYNPNNIFKKIENEKTAENKENIAKNSGTELVKVIEKKWYEKILGFLKSIFGINK